jgi:hypothetical protein
LSASFASDCWDASSVFVRCCARQSRSISSFCSSGEHGARLQAVVLLRARLGGLRGLLRDALNRGVALSVIADRGIAILDRLDVAAQCVLTGLYRIILGLDLAGFPSSYTKITIGIPDNPLSMSRHAEDRSASYSERITSGDRLSRR